GRIEHTEKPAERVMAGHAILKLEKPAGTAPSPWRTDPCPPSLARRTEPRTSLSPKSHESRAARRFPAAGRPNPPSIRQSDPKQISRAANHPRPGRIHLVQYRKIRPTRPKNSKCDSPGPRGPRD